MAGATGLKPATSCVTGSRSQGRPTRCSKVAAVFQTARPSRSQVLQGDLKCCEVF